MPASRSPSSIPLLLKLGLVAWMAAMTLMFVAVSLPTDGPVALIAPEFLLQARALLLPFFQAPSLY